MDLVNVERLHQFQSQNDLEARAIRGVMIQKREFLQCIEREIAQLVETKKGVEQDLVRLGIALGPHNHSLFPNEILGRIFVFLAQNYGTVEFPFFKNLKVPPQLVVSHVCSHWRRVALRTPELWRDTRLFYTPTNGPPHFVRLLQRWLSRARTFPVTLSINFEESLDGDGLGVALQNILLPIQVKKLSLSLTYKVFMALSTVPEETLSGLSEFRLGLTFHGRLGQDMSHPHPLITRLQSLTLRRLTEAWIVPPHPSLPWDQLRYLAIEVYLDLPLIMAILGQIPKLEGLTLRIPQDAGMLEQPVEMPSLRAFVLNAKVVIGTEVDKMLRCFMCPTLTMFKFALLTHGNWTCETFGILKQQYNIEKLREAVFVGNFSLPVSSFLRDAPMLHSLSLSRNAIMDDDAVIGVSNGTLGRFLRKLDINIACDVGEVLGMVEARKKMVDALLKNGCTWREEITVLKDVVFHTAHETRYKDRVLALKEAGITITFV
jgi:hypothetical protein